MKMLFYNYYKDRYWFRTYPRLVCKRKNCTSKMKLFIITESKSCFPRKKKLRWPMAMMLWYVENRQPEPPCAKTY